MNFFVNVCQCLRRNMPVSPVCIRIELKRFGAITLQHIHVRDYAKHSKTTIEERLPKKPRRPLNGFFIFINEKRPQMVKDHPTLKSTEWNVLMGEMWRSLSHERKDEYSKGFEEKKALYKDQFREYKRALTEDDKKAIEELKAQNAKRKEKLNKLKQQRDLGKPKCPLRGFHKYFAERLQGSGVGKPEFRKFQRAVGKEYRALSEAEKTKYQYPPGIEEYFKALYEWEAKMIKNGRFDIVKRVVPKLKKVRRTKTE